MEDAMMLTARDYYTRVAKLAVDAFQKDNHSLWLAMGACMIVLHVVDYVMHNREPDPIKADDAIRRYSEQATEDHFAFRAVREYSLASKHCRRRANGFHSGKYMQAYPCVAGIMRCGQSFLGDTIGGITIRLQEHQNVNLTTVLQKTLEIYEADFPELTFDPASPNGPATEEAMSCLAPASSPPTSN